MPKYLITIVGHSFANMYKLTVIVIDKLIGLGGTVYTWVSIFMSHLYTIYHQSTRSETLLQRNGNDCWRILDERLRCMND